ncbi:tetratricopeptide repeat protein [Streptomyces sp. NPDC004787]|uniref:tetratricopeptide repeat protein n=1 Tax=Streptomyces sp. NPDC004787 TaxID=3154291 RepID=UPI0033B06EC6
MVNLATAYRQLGDLGQATAHYTQAIAILTPHVTPSHPTLAAARHGLALASPKTTDS